MADRRLRLTVAVAVLVASACAMDSVEHKSEKPSGARIQMGEGHLNRDGKAFHYWDKEKEIPAVCARCHAATGVAQYLTEGKNTPAPHVKNAFACTNCHADMLTYARHTVAKVTFPSGLTVDSGNNDANLCMTCHQGRESTASANKAIAALGPNAGPDTPNPKLVFVHVHYFPAGATVYGTDAKVAYEYAGKAYAGRFNHVASVNTCTACHEPHAGAVLVEKCGTCHQGVKNLADAATIRMSTKGDFDGNGREEGLAREVANLQRELYAAIQQYARAVGGTSIAFSPEAFPYWYTDTNGNGKIDPEELRPDNRYTAYTPRLEQATYNYTYVLRDPGAAYHNGRYTLQLLYDSLDSLAASGKAGVEMRGKVRP
ncbi:MAG TPA: polyheme membrane-associated cytochrome C [Candidatus Eisenbacteria bacterium]|nr:polyheme membrane-associated cytochrome C [Candidatus Eisenbacteria bacterium]